MRRIQIGILFVVVIILGALIWGFLLNMSEWRQAPGCYSNLRHIHALATSNAGQPLPRAGAAGGIAQPLQALVDREPGAFLPRNFICPEGNEEPLTLEGGAFLLTEGSCSYQMVPWQVEPTTDAIWLFDRAPHHRGWRNVVCADGSLHAWEDAEFQRRLDQDRRRFASPERR